MDSKEGCSRTTKKDIMLCFGGGTSVVAGDMPWAVLYAHIFFLF